MIADACTPDWMSQWSRSACTCATKERLKNLQRTCQLFPCFTSTKQWWDIAALRREMLPDIEAFWRVLRCPLQPWFVLPADKF